MYWKSSLVFLAKKNCCGSALTSGEHRAKWSSRVILEVHSDLGDSVDPGFWIGDLEAGLSRVKWVMLNFPLLFVKANNTLAKEDVNPEWNLVLGGVITTLKVCSGVKRAG